MLISALEDLKLRTLARLPGAVGRFLYVAGLHSGDGYEHWGLQRSYGEAAACQALASAHSEVLVELLRTPLRELSHESDESMAGDLGGAVVPPGTGKAAEAHFNSVAAALAALAVKNPAGTGRAA